MISKILYYLILKPISLLPLPILYLLNPPFRFLLFVLFGYRKKVISNQLMRSFPDKTEKELQSIASKFQVHFIDVILESIKAFSMGIRECNRRCQIKNPEVLTHYFEQKRNVAVVMAHYASWEYPCMMVQSQYKNPFYVIFADLKDAFFNEKIKKSRSLSGSRLVSRKGIFKAVNDEKDPYAIVFMADQSPSSIKKAYWGPFLNQPTAFNHGVASFAQKYDMVVVFAEVAKVKRGHYSIIVHPLIENPKNTSTQDITMAHASFLEKLIIKRPELWLWSHKRWKYEPPTEKSVSS